MLPLAPAVIAILETVPRIDGIDLIFPSTRSSSANPISGFSKALATAHRLSGTSDWDLARSEADLPHGVRAGSGSRPRSASGPWTASDGTRSPIAAIYDVHSYQSEMRQALERWAAELDRIVTGGEAKVVALRRA